MSYFHGGKWYGRNQIVPSGTSRPLQGASINESGLENYAIPFSGVKRHNVIFNNTGAFTALAADAHVILSMLAFRRTFTAANDVDDTPSASNNYGTTNVFNGSRIENYQAKMTFQNTSSTTPVVLDVYEIALSFYEAKQWLDVFPTRCPLLYDTAVGPPDTRGQVSIDGAKSLTGFRLQDFKNFKFLQKFMEYKGALVMGIAGDNPNVELNIFDIPSKCRRSNSGMFYGLLFHNSTDKNNGVAINLKNTNEISFDEIPSDRRMPYIQ